MHVISRYNNILQNNCVFPIFESGCCKFCLSITMLSILELNFVILGLSLLYVTNVLRRFKTKSSLRWYLSWWRDINQVINSYFRTVVACLLFTSGRRTGIRVMSSMAWMVLSWKPGKWNWVQRQEAISVEAVIGHKAIFPTYLFVLLHLIQTKNKWVDPQDTFLGEWFQTQPFIILRWKWKYLVLCGDQKLRWGI